MKMKKRLLFALAILLMGALLPILVVAEDASIHDAHEKGNWSYDDETQHKAVCSCGEMIYEDHEWLPLPGSGCGDKVYFTCFGCDAEKEELNNTEHDLYADCDPVDITYHQRYCKNCALLIYEEHEWSSTPGVEGEDYICLDCGLPKDELMSDEHDLQFSWSTEGHSKACKNCLFVEFEEHDFGEGVVTVEPTDTEVGEMTYRCVCGWTKTEEIAKLGAENNQPDVLPEELPTVKEPDNTETKDDTENEPSGNQDHTDNKNNTDDNDDITISLSGCSAMATGGAGVMTLLMLAGVCLISKKKQD